MRTCEKTDCSIELTVIVVSYNSSLEKTLRTIRSVIRQAGIALELIVSDDGSSDNHFDSIERFLINENFSNYKLISNKINIGTVENLYKACRQASGIYIKAISPGDYLYDNHVCLNAVNFMRTNIIRIAFGKAAYYRRVGEALVVGRVFKPRVMAPYRSEPQDSREVLKRLIADDCILGAAIIIERELALKFLGKAIGKVRLFEDKTITLLAAAIGETIRELPFYFVWYEIGCGVTSSAVRAAEYRTVFDADDRALQDLLEEELGREFLHELLEEATRANWKNVRLQEFIAQQCRRIRNCAYVLSGTIDISLLRNCESDTSDQELNTNESHGAM